MTRDNPANRGDRPGGPGDRRALNGLCLLFFAAVVAWTIWPWLGTVFAWVLGGWLVLFLGGTIVLLLATWSSKDVPSHQTDVKRRV